MMWREMSKIEYSKYDTLLKQSMGSCDILDSATLLGIERRNSNISNSHPEKLGLFLSLSSTSHATEFPLSRR